MGEVKLAGHPESFQLEPSGSRIFVNVPDARQVGGPRSHVDVDDWDVAGERCGGELLRWPSMPRTTACISAADDRLWF